MKSFFAFATLALAAASMATPTFSIVLDPGPWYIDIYNEGNANTSTSVFVTGTMTNLLSTSQNYDGAGGAPPQIVLLDNNYFIGSQLWHELPGTFAPNQSYKGILARLLIDKVNSWVPLGTYDMKMVAPSTDGESNVVQLQVVPEPTTVAALGVGALGLLRRRRK